MCIRGRVVNEGSDEMQTWMRVDCLHPSNSVRNEPEECSRKLCDGRAKQTHLCFIVVDFEFTPPACREQSARRW